MGVIGKRIHERRRALGYTQDQLGEMVGVKKGAEGKWETGVAEPGEPTMRELARVLGVTVEWLRGGDPKVSSNVPASRAQPPPPGVSGSDPAYGTPAGSGPSEGRSGPPGRLVELLELLVKQVDAYAPELLEQDPKAWGAAAEHLFFIERFVTEQKAAAEAAADEEEAPTPASRAPAADTDEPIPLHVKTKAAPGGGAVTRIGFDETNLPPGVEFHPEAAVAQIVEGMFGGQELGEAETVAVRRFYRAAAGEPIDSERGPDEEHVPAHLCRRGPERCRVVQAVGDSMDLEDIADGDLVLYTGRDSYTGGDMVVAQRIDPATEEPTGEHTIKRRRRAHDVVWLFPQSSNPEHELQQWPAAEERVMGVVIARRDDRGIWHPVHHRPAKDFTIPNK